MARPKVVQHHSPADRAEQGKAARAASPRAAHAEWSPPADRRSPVSILLEQAETRVPELVPIRHARMTTSPFAFYRGAAAVMAADLAKSPVSGLRVQCCGDAHLANFGGFAAPDRTMVFDMTSKVVNDPGGDARKLWSSI